MFVKVNVNVSFKPLFSRDSALAYSCKLVVLLLFRIK